jgi:hypothetical protein
MGRSFALIGAAIFVAGHAQSIDTGSTETFVYARNLANGMGAVYNPGKHVEGYSNFLWTMQ